MTVRDGAEPQDDRQLLQAHLRGDARAFGELFRRHRDRLWSVALRTLGDREEAADALQDAMVSAFRNAASYRGEAAVTTWLHRIVVNACLDRARRRTARPSVPLPDGGLPYGRDDHTSSETRLDVRAALRQLPEAQRIAIVLVEMEDLPVAEVAVILGIPEGTVKSRCSRGRTALALLLRDQQSAADDDAQGNVAPTPRVGFGGEPRSGRPDDRSGGER